MKKVLFLLVCALVIGGLFAACGGASKPVSLKSNVIRLHVLANSDSDTDQQIKLAVRDLMLNRWGKQLSLADSSADAWKEVKALLPEIKKGVDGLLGELGADYTAAVETGTYDFPARDYDGVAFPEGKYRAVRVELGAASGHNWWCVMFPPLCLIGDNGEMSIEDYKDLVRKLDEEGLNSQGTPEAPVRSWLFDELFGKGDWDRDFLKWAKEYWLGDDQ